MFSYAVAYQPISICEDIHIYIDTCDEIDAVNW